MPNSVVFELIAVLLAAFGGPVGLAPIKPGLQLVAVWGGRVDGSSARHPALSDATSLCMEFLMHQSSRRGEEEEKFSSYQLSGAEIACSAARAVFLAWLVIVLVPEMLAVV